MRKEDIEYWWDDDVLAGEMMVSLSPLHDESDTDVPLSLVCPLAHNAPCPTPQPSVTLTNLHHGATSLLRRILIHVPACCITTFYERLGIQSCGGSAGG